MGVEHFAHRFTLRNIYETDPKNIPKGTGCQYDDCSIQSNKSQSNGSCSTKNRS